MKMLREIVNIVRGRRKHPEEGSYTNRLLKEEGLVERKLSEEAFEVVEAAWKGKKKDLVYEAADLLYHLVVLLEKNQVSLKEVEQELTRRQK